MATTGARTAQPGTERDLPHIAAVGMTELYVPPSNADVLADVVFVHGLKGGPRDTWMHANKTKAGSGAKLLRNCLSFGRSKSRNRADQPTDALDCYWPLDLLSKDLEDVRILVYGYDSYPTHYYKRRTTRMTITEHAEDLLHRLAGLRSACRGRPVIFIAHSLGGILVKGALIESHVSTQDPYADILQSCYAIIFMGTPHLGAEIAVFGKFLSNSGGLSTYSKVLEGLEPQSETLYNISRRFNTLLNQPIEARDKIQICSVQEGQGMMSMRGAGMMKIRGARSKVRTVVQGFDVADGEQVVENDSSKFNRTDIEQSFVNQTADHKNMCKFATADDENYKDIVRVLEMYCQVLKDRAAASREEQDSAQSPLALGW